MRKNALVMSFVFAAATCIGLVAPSNCLATTMNTTVAVEGLSSTYTPGSFVEFEIAMPPISNLGSYNIDLVLTSDTGLAGTDFFFDVEATVPADSGYVFFSDTNFFDAVSSDSASTLRLTLTDFDFNGVDVVADANDRVARVFIGTAAAFSGDLILSLDVDSLLLDTPDITPTAVAGFDEIKTAAAAQAPTTVTVVPEPTTWVYVLIALLGICTSQNTRHCYCR